MNISINTNEDVTVVLTETGERIYRDYYKQWPDLIKISKGKKIKTQLWELMSIFGPHMYNGCMIPFKGNATQFDVAPEDFIDPYIGVHYTPPMEETRDYNEDQ